VADRPIRPQKVAPRSFESVTLGLGISLPSSDHSALVSGVAISAQAVLPGDVFVALPGRVHHGASFASQAIEQGASAIVTDP